LVTLSIIIHSLFFLFLLLFLSLFKRELYNLYAAQMLQYIMSRALQ